MLTIVCNFAFWLYGYSMAFYKVLLITLTVPFIVSCNSDDDTKHPDDPFGIIEAENIGGQTDRLVLCSQNEKCPEHAQALFWVAADILSEASAETIEVEAKDFGLTADMTIEQMTQQIGPLLEDLIKVESPNYDFADPEFKRGLEIMYKAHKAGSVFASNELGVLFMEQVEMQDLGLAKIFFNEALKNNDAYGAYNLARIARMENPSDFTVALEYLKLAADSKQEELEILYMLGMESFGDNEEKLAASRYLEAKGIGPSSLRDEFEAHFNVQGNE